MDKFVFTEHHLNTIYIFILSFIAKLNFNNIFQIFISYNLIGEEYYYIVDKIYYNNINYFMICLQEILGDWEKILLCAGNSYLISPLVFSLKKRATLGKIYLNKLSGQSAGNFIKNKNGSTKATASTSQTIQVKTKDGVVAKLNNLPRSRILLGNTTYKHLPKISEHVPKHKSNLSDKEFGYFLAGLIEGDGWFGLNQLHIIFSEKDISLAYYIKKRIGYGNVYKIKDKKAVRYICKNKKGLYTILSLINGKLVSEFKYRQLINHNYNKNFNLELKTPLKKLSLDNYWLAGFTQADGCFHISIAKSKTHKTGFSVRLEFSIKQNDCIPLKLLIENIKLGNLSQYTNGIWCYKSSGYKTAWTLINYFDSYNLFAGKYVDYLKFRKVYIMITEGKHLESEGIAKIKRIRPNKESSETSTQEIEI